MGLDITVIGLGEVGCESFKELSKRASGDRVIGVDINKERLDAFRKDGYRVTDTVPPSDVYIVAVYTTVQAKDVLNKLNLCKEPLISIESTLDPKELGNLEQWADEKHTDLATCPHRFNPNDPAHRVFNLDRVLGGVTPRATSRAMEFYGRFMPQELLHASDFRHAALCKVVENAYRFMEIVLAQELRLGCENTGDDFDELRKLMNTKWNIDLKDALKGVAGKCLPKDMMLTMEYFGSPAMQFLHERNESYKQLQAS